MSNFYAPPLVEAEDGETKESGALVAFIFVASAVAGIAIGATYDSNPTPQPEISDTSTINKEK